MRKGARNKAVTLYSPDGREYTTSDKVEATNLRMRAGYTDRPPTAKRKTGAVKKTAASPPPDSGGSGS